MAQLTPTEFQSYQEQGFVIPAFRLSETKLSRLRSALDRVIAANPDTRPEHLVSVHIDDSGEEGVAGDSTFLEIARDPDVLDLVEQMLGPDIILWGCQAFCKPPGDGMEVPWHQDGHYWPIKPLATCTVWIAIDDSVIENGCLRVIPRSHQGHQLHEHLKEERDDIVLNQRIGEDFFDENTAIDVELKAGEMSLHDVYLIHGSNPNRSTRRRAGLAIRYMPGNSHFDREFNPIDSSIGYTVDFSGRPLWLVRGKDATGKNNFEIGHS